MGRRRSEKNMRERGPARSVLYSTRHHYQKEETEKSESEG